MPRPEELKQAYRTLKEKEDQLEADSKQLKERIVEWKGRYDDVQTDLEQVQEAIKSLDDNIPDDTPVEVDPNADV